MTVSTRSRITTASTLITERPREAQGSDRARGLTLFRGLATPSAVVVQGELGRVRPEADDIDLVLALVGDPGADQVLAEDAPAREELVVALERIERLPERARHLRDPAIF